MMDQYTKSFKKGINYYDKDLKKVLPLITNREHVALCSSLSTGEERFIEYISFKLELANKYKVINIQNSFIDALEVINIIKKSSELVVVLIPYFYKDVEFFSKFLNTLYQSFKNQEFIAVIKLGWDFYKDPSKYSNIAPFLTNILVRQPLDVEGVKENLEIRNKIYGWDIPKHKEKEILKLSGGLMRIVKRIAKYYEANGNIETENLLKYPALEVVLTEIAEMYKNLSAESLRKLGILDKDNNIKSSLLAEYISGIKITPKKELTGNSRALFNLLYQNRNQLVTDEMIDDIVRKGKSGSLWANYKLVDRLRNNIAEDFKIRTVKGKGYVLSEK